MSGVQHLQLLWAGSAQRFLGEEKLRGCSPAWEGRGGAFGSAPGAGGGVSDDNR